MTDLFNFEHEENMKELLVRKEAYRIWFEFYKIASNSNQIVIKNNLSRCSSFYESWGDVRTIKFDDWWITHKRLFTEKTGVKLLLNGQQRQTNDSLVIEVPLNQSTTNLIKEIKLLIDSNRVKLSTQSKSKNTVSTSYQLSNGAEPKLASIREMLTVYKDVYLKDTSLRGQDLYAATYKYYSSRKRKNMMPPSLTMTYADEKNRVFRNLRRWIQKSEKILLNVSTGVFPGDFEK